MFVVTADQVDSQHQDDLVGPVLDEIVRISADRLILPADRTAGDEIQAATEDAGTALDLVLHLISAGSWSVGLGIGDVRLPLPESTRAMGGTAFVAARSAVESAKSRSTRFCVVAADDRAIGGGTLQPIIDLLLTLRQRRTPEGWELHELLSTGITQREAAERLGITPQAVSLRAIAAGLRLDAEARAAITEILTVADERIAPVILIASIVAWSGAIVVVLGSVVLAIIAIRLRQPAIGLIGVLPVAAGIVAIAFGLSIPPPHDSMWTVVALGLAALAVVGGNPLTVWVLEFASRGDVDGGAHGGILVREKGARTKKEVLRGGTWIGYLERIAVVAGVITLHFEVIAAVIAIKGLGRFSELDSAEARERFIIGTLVSMIWAGACATLIIF